MNYRKFLDTGTPVSALGFGCMRLPTTGRNSDIDEKLASRMLRHAIDEGVNYVDTAYPYHDGNSEIFLGRALRDGYREKVMLATKSPLWLIKEKGDFERYFREQLRRLRTDRVDVYLYHSLGKETWSRLRRIGMLEWGEEARADGRIGRIGFSFHDDVQTFKTIIDGYDGWNVCLIQYNYMNEDTQAGTEGLRYAAERGISVMIMEPLLGGQLARPPEGIRSLMNSANGAGAFGRTPADLALQWLWHKPEVTTVLSGMSAMEQVLENLESAGRSGVGALTKAELDLLAQVQKAYKGMFPVPCTRCGYCMPCPGGVDIPRVFVLYNEAVAFNQLSLNRNIYRGVLSKSEQAGACTRCGECEERCPQRIEIRDWMPRIHRELGSR
jgi:predicted aldo/keto reductase-like oxidoreductase